MVTSFLGGVLSANSLPHLATAAAGKTHLTPIGGNESNRRINLAWGASNLLGGLALIRAGAGEARTRCDQRLIAFNLGAAALAAWMVASESTMRVNWSRMRH